MNNLRIQKIFILKEFFLIVTLFLGMLLLPYFYIAIVFFLFILWKQKRYFESFTYLIFFKHLNPIFHPAPSFLIILIIILLFLYYLFKILFFKKFIIFKFEKLIYFLFLLIFIDDFFGSKFIEYSQIRIIFLFIFIFVIFRIIENEKNDIRAFFIKLYLYLVIFSFPLLFFTQGYLYGVPFFKGILNHSQDFGVVLLPLLSFYLYNFLENKILKTKISYLFLFMGIIELIMTYSRGAVFGFFLGIFIYLVSNFYKLKIKKITAFILLVFMGLSIIVVYNNFNYVENKIEKYILKYKNLNNAPDELIATRLTLMKKEIEYFKENILVGIGFNVQLFYQDPRVQENLDKLIKKIPGTDIVYSRPLEKGNLYLSVFEENGIIVGFVFIYILLWLLKFYLNEKTIFFSYLPMLFNFNAEASLLSPLGIGNIQWLILLGFYYIIICEKKGKG